MLMQNLPGLMNDAEIIDYVAKCNMISPFTPHRCKINNKPSYGLNSCGYDVRLSPEIFISKETDIVMDPCASVEHNAQCFKKIKAEEYFIMPPYSFILGITLEDIALPDDVSVLVIGKSTYARCGIFINITSIENDAKIGKVVLEIANSSCNSVKIYTGGDSGICKFLFLKTHKCLNGYNGVYKNQQSVVFPGI